jgi:hypothetical protein
MEKLGRFASRERRYVFVVTRLVRNCALGRMTQYSRDVDDRTDEPRRAGYPAFAGYDGCCAASVFHRHCERSEAIHRAA